MRSTQDEFQVLTAAAAANTFGKPMKVSDFRHLLAMICTTGSFNGTINIKGSIQESMPDFSSAQSKTNQWDYIQAKKYTDATTVDGVTGVVSAGTDINLLLEINTNGLTWVTIDLVLCSAGIVDAFIKPFNDSI